MTEKFTYSAKAKIYRRKTFTAFQKFILSSIWILISMAIIGGVMLQQKNILPPDQWVLMTVIFSPLVLGVILMFIIAINPKGPEADFELPAFEVDLGDASTVKGKVILRNKEARPVEVLVQNVYSSSTNILDDSGMNGTSGFAYEEMFEMALEEVQKKYPEAKWVNTPEVVS